MPWFRRMNFVAEPLNQQPRAIVFMRPLSLCRKAPALLLGAFGAATVLAGPASAQSLLDNAPMKSTLSFLGIITPDRDPIEYHERPPLVVPKSMALPAPAAQHASARNEAWPVDPDAARKAKEKAEASRPVRVSGSQGSENPDNATMSIWQVLAGRSTSAPIQPAGPTPDISHSDHDYLVPNGVLHAQGQQFAAHNPDSTSLDEIRPGYEPKRRYLTDPPTGYRKPSDKATFKKQYGAPAKKEDESALAFVRKEAERQKGSYDPDKQD
jgi:hypothetical protein